MSKNNTLAFRWYYLVLIVPMFVLVSCEEAAQLLFDMVRADTEFPLTECDEITPKTKTATVNILVIDRGSGEPKPGVTFTANIRHRELKTLFVEGKFKCIRIETDETVASVTTGLDGRASITSPAYVLDRAEEAIQFMYYLRDDGGTYDRGYIEFNYHSSAAQNRSWEVYGHLRQ